MTLNFSETAVKGLSMIEEKLSTTSGRKTYEVIRWAWQGKVVTF